VLVVGAGPAGASAAYKAASNGLKTIIIDKKIEIGVPIQCAEAIGKYLIPLVPFKIPKNQFIWDIHGISIYYDDLMITKTGNDWAGYSINREKFDKWLFNKAIKANARSILNCELVDLKFENEYAKHAYVKAGNRTKKIKFKILIACDGVYSTVREICNLGYEKIGSIAHVYSFEMKNLNIKNPEFEQVYVGEFTPSGYAYIFPKSKNKANVGVGGIFPKKKMETYFSEFLEIPYVKKQLKNGKIIDNRSGYAPFAGFGHDIVFNNILFAGDSANQNIKPFIEGILPGVICGYYAGKIAAKTIRSNNIIQLNEYPKTINKILGEIFENSNPLIDIMIDLFRMQDKKKYYLIFAIAASLIKPNEIKYLKNLDDNEIEKIIRDRIINGENNEI